MDARTPRIVITGLGLVTPYGTGPDGIIAGIGSSRPAYGPLTAIDASTMPVQVGGWVPEVTPAQLGVGHNKLRGMGKYVKLGLVAATAALEHAGLRQRPPAPDRIGAFIATGTHGHNAEGLFAAFADSAGENDRLDLRKLGSDGVDRVHPWWLLTTISNNLIFFVTHILGIEGANTNCCNSGIAGAYALERAVTALRCGEIDVALVGGADTPLNWQMISDLAQIGVLAEGDAATVLPMRAFHAGAPGTVLSDAGAFLVLESERHAAARQAKPLAEVRAVALHGEFTDPIHPAADGRETAAVMTRLLADVPGDEMVQINAAATGLARWDTAEAAGLATAGAGRNVAVGSAKPWLGHAWSVSFIVETAVSVLMLQHQLGLGLPTITGSNAELALHQAPNGTLPHAWAINLGQCFGGNTAGVLLHDA